MAQNPFELLGFPLSFAIELRTLEARHRELSKTVHPDRHASEGVSSKAGALALAVSINEAFRILRDPLQRATALCAALGAAVVEKAVPPEFLMEVMEKRESLSEARAQKNHAALEALGLEAQADVDVLTRKLAKVFDERAEPSPEGLGSVVGSLLSQLRFATRFSEEVELSLED
jgi:molecular chaperone HscB